MEIVNFSLTDTAVIEECIRQMHSLITPETADQTIFTNMVGQVPWSMSNLLKNGERFNRGFLTAMFSEGQLVAITGCDINSLVWKDALQFGIRLWVNPKFRASPGLLSSLVSPALSFAREQKKRAWTSFNDDRHALMRFIKIRATHSDPSISSLWVDFHQLPDKHDVHFVMQHVVYKDFSGSQALVVESKEYTDPSPTILPQNQTHQL